MTMTETPPMTAVQTEGPDPRRYWSLAVIAVAQLMIVLDASVVIVALPSAQRALHISVANRQWVMRPTRWPSAACCSWGAGSPTTSGVGACSSSACSASASPRPSGAGPESSHALRRPGPAGGVRGRHGTGGPVASHGDLHRAPRAGPSLRCLRRHRRRGSGHRARARRHADPVGVVALDPAHQCAHRRCSPPSAASRVVRESRGESRAGYDLPGAVDRHRWAVPPRLRLHHRRHPRVGSAAHRGAAGRVGGAARHLRRHRASVVAPAAPAAGRARPQPRRVVPGLAAGRERACSGTFLFLTYFFQGTLHYSALKTGFAFLPFSGGIIIGAGLASRLLPRTGPRALMVAGLTLAAGGLVWFTRLGVRQHLPGPRAPARDPGQPRHGDDLRPHEQHGAGRCRAQRRRCGQRAGQHHPTGRGIARHRPAQHRGGHRRRHLPGRPRSSASADVRPRRCTGTRPPSPSVRCCWPAPRWWPGCSVQASRHQVGAEGDQGSADEGANEGADGRRSDGRARAPRDRGVSGLTRSARQRSA